MEKPLLFSCPLCGQKTHRPVSQMKKGAVLVCPFCKLTLTLHGHMLEDVKREIGELAEKKGGRTRRPRR